MRRYVGAILDSLVIALVYLAARIVEGHVNPKRGEVVYLDGKICCTSCRGRNSG